MGERSTQVPPIAGWLMIVGGVALAGLTFVDWYELFGVGVNAWQTLTRTDVAIFAAGIVAAACGAWLVFGDVGPERRVVAPFGALAAGVRRAPARARPGGGGGQRGRAGGGPATLDAHAITVIIGLTPSDVGSKLAS